MMEKDLKPTKMYCIQSIFVERLVTHLICFLIIWVPRYLKNNFTQIATCLPVQNSLSEKVSKVDCEVNNIIIIYLINNGYVPISALESLSNNKWQIESATYWPHDRDLLAATKWVEKLSTLRILRNFLGDSNKFKRQLEEIEFEHPQINLFDKVIDVSFWKIIPVKKYPLHRITQYSKSLFGSHEIFSSCLTSNA
ncbi:hypothetical protein AGLY_015531 [Aphis glycines]|uniref:Uncharacterized protein n=1 Tax=Aphis glycines TaxID=307491 RepID=A0A6G0T075_APHGL|nr:hypothetical protein AGLY_015531 [Aphis glycines]